MWNYKPSASYPLLLQVTSYTVANVVTKWSLPFLYAVHDLSPFPRVKLKENFHTDTYVVNLNFKIFSYLFCYYALHI